MSTIEWIITTTMLCLLTFFLGYDAQALDLDLNDLYELIYTWQTLIAGLLALAGASWTVATMSKQNKIQSKELELQIQRQSDYEKRKELRANAYLHDSCAETQKYLEQIFICIHENWGKDKVKNANRPNIPDLALNNIKAAVEFMPLSHANHCLEFLSLFQVFHARLDRWKRPNHPPIIRENNHILFDLCVLDAKLIQIWNYVREADIKERNHTNIYLNAYSQLARSIRFNNKDQYNQYYSIIEEELAINNQEQNPV